jgi:hypothetical protein
MDGESSPADCESQWAEVVESNRSDPYAGLSSLSFGSGCMNEEEEEVQEAEEVEEDGLGRAGLVCDCDCDCETADAAAEADLDAVRSEATRLLVVGGCERATAWPTASQTWCWRLVLPNGGMADGEWRMAWMSEGRRRSLSGTR